MGKHLSDKSATSQTTTLPDLVVGRHPKWSSCTASTSASLAYTFNWLIDEQFEDHVLNDLDHFLSSESKCSSSADCRGDLGKPRVLVFPPVTDHYRFLIHKVVREHREKLHSESIGTGDRRRTVVCRPVLLVRDRICEDPDGEADRLVQEIREKAERQSARKRKAKENMERAKRRPDQQRYVPAARRQAQSTSETPAEPSTTCHAKPPNISPGDRVPSARAIGRGRAKPVPQLYVPPPRRRSHHSEPKGQILANGGDSRTAHQSKQQETKCGKVNKGAHEGVESGADLQTIEDSSSTNFRSGNAGSLTQAPPSPYEETISRQAKQGSCVADGVMSESGMEVSVEVHPSINGSKVVSSDSTPSIEGGSVEQLLMTCDSQVVSEEPDTASTLELNKSHKAVVTEGLYQEQPVAVNSAEASPTVNTEEIFTSLINGEKSATQDNEGASTTEENERTSSAEENGEISTAEKNEEMSAAEANEETSAAVDKEGVSASENNKGTSAAVGKEGVSASENKKATSAAEDNEKTSAEVVNERISAAVFNEGLSAVVFNEGISLAVVSEGLSAAAVNEGLSAAVVNERTCAAADSEQSDISNPSTSSVNATVNSETENQNASVRTQDDDVMSSLDGNHETLPADTASDQTAIVSTPESGTKVKLSKKQMKRAQKEAKKKTPKAAARKKTDGSNASRSPVKAAEKPKSAGADDEEQDSWDAKFDEEGECLDDDLMDELKEKFGEVEVCKPLINYLDFTPRGPELDEARFGHLVEIYDFDASLKTPDLLSIFTTSLTKEFDIKWVDDTHAIGVFSSSGAAQDALVYIHPLVKTRPLSQASRQTKLKAKNCTEFLLPKKARPDTTASTARRLVASSLGLTAKVTQEQRKKEKEQLKHAKEKKRDDRNTKESVWEGTVAEGPITNDNTRSQASAATTTQVGSSRKKWDGSIGKCAMDNV